jgi:phosphatidylglycerophosphate synthase
MQSVLGTILDPAADKTLMTTLTVTLAMKGMLPGTFITSTGCAPAYFGCSVVSECDNRARRVT